MRPEHANPGNDCGDALGILDRILAASPDDTPTAETYNAMAEASRCLVRMRDGLIARRRAGEEVGQRLDHVNAVLSVAFGGEYPLVGVRRKRIEKARDLLRGLQEGQG
ncbi:MAG TPA: hypothetical protein VD995_22540 [Azospirillum sp.]|nr:hypothetical protein [Azospirillum sp.]